MFYLSFPPYSNAYVPMICELFVKRNTHALLLSGLRHNLLLHLLNLVDFNLLRGEDISAALSHIDGHYQSHRAYYEQHHAAATKPSSEES